ncbi:MAG: hypothetical protein ACJ72J_19720 [Nitrososphaeraceae archaeon]
MQNDECSANGCILEAYDIPTYDIQNPNASDFESKKKRTEDIGRELYADGVIDIVIVSLTC